MEEESVEFLLNFFVKDLSKPNLFLAVGCVYVVLEWALKTVLNLRVLKKLILSASDSVDMW